MVEIESKVMNFNKVFINILTYCTINIICFTNNIFTHKELSMSLNCKGIERIVLSRHSPEFNSIFMAFLVFIYTYKPTMQECPFCLFISSPRVSTRGYS
jgi:hypothetical protein